MELIFIFVFIKYKYFQKKNENSRKRIRVNAPYRWGSAEGLELIKQVAKEVRHNQESFEVCY